MSGLRTKGAPKGDGSGFGPQEVPSEDNHKAAVTAIVELGTHNESFEGGPAKPKHKVAVAFEILGEKKANGDPFVFVEVYTFSTHENAAFRKVWEACRGKARQESDIVNQDPDCLLGMPVILTIDHNKAKKLREGETELRTYANITNIAPADKADRLKRAKTVHMPFIWDFSSPNDYVDHEWLGYIYDRSQGKRVPLSEMIARSAERQGKVPAGATNGAADVEDDGEAF